MTASTEPNTDVESLIVGIARAARAASRKIANLPAESKNTVLEAMAERLVDRTDAIREANEKDLAAARDAGLPPAMIDRLTLTSERIEKMSAGVRAVVALPDPVGRTLRTTTRPNGLVIRKLSVPLGVVGIIFESRPNVTVEAAVLCLKSGNATILRGGKEAIRTNRVLGETLSSCLGEFNLPTGAIQVVPTTDRAAVGVLLRQDESIDLIVPRGGEALIRRVAEESLIPVIKHYKGICHVYVDKGADLEMARAIAFNAKCQRPGVCNAMETLLIHRDVADELLPELARAYDEAGVEIRADAAVREALPQANPATDADWDNEYLDLILNVRTVESLDEAVEHIARHGSGHSDAIVTDDKDAAERFVQAVDSACVFVNASTRFSDGFEFGLGAEIGISTDKLHARGPMGLEELTTYKYVVQGEGQVRT